MRSLVSRLRRREDGRVAAARAAHASGRFAEARRILAPVVDEGDASLEVIRGMAELGYLLGVYATAEMLLRKEHTRGLDDRLRPHGHDVRSGRAWVGSEQATQEDDRCSDG